MQLIDPAHPIYRPLWVRVLIVLVCFGWCATEILFGDALWAMLSGAAGAYSAYLLLLTYKPPVETSDVKSDEAPVDAVVPSSTESAERNPD